MVVVTCVDQDAFVLLPAVARCVNPSALVFIVVASLLDWKTLSMRRPDANMGKMGKNGQKRGQKWSKTAQKQGFLGVSGKTSKRTIINDS